MDVTNDILNLLESIVNFLKVTTFTAFSVTFSLWNVLIGGVVLFLIFYFIFKIAE